MNMCDVCLRLWREGKQKEPFPAVTKLGPLGQHGTMQWSIDLCDQHAAGMAEAMNAAAQHHRTGAEMLIIHPMPRQD